MSFAAALGAARRQPRDVESLIELASEALGAGEEEEALELIKPALGSSQSARLWQWNALLLRSIDEHEEALASFGQAARLDPADASIAHGHARVALEAGVPAETLYEKARSLAPSDPAVQIGLAAARLAAKHGEQAEAELDAALTQAPMWIEGHAQLAQLRSMLGRPQELPRSLERAIGQQPNQPALWFSLFDLYVKAKCYEDLDQAVAVARSRGVSGPLLRPYETIAVAELGQTERADRLFSELEASGSPPMPIWRIRHLLRSGRAAEASPLIERELAGANSANTWPYASVAWRLLGDPRHEWLEHDERLVSVVDLADALSLDELASTLRALHVAKGEYLDQSLRGGTQTDGPLLSRIDPVIRTLRRAIVGAVQDYVRQLPPSDPTHPLLRHRRDRRIRFSGSWSVRLRDGGFHESHVHPQGWISSAFYVDLPPADSTSQPHAGWLQLGQPPADLGVEEEPRSIVKPERGSLVLFPSWMWHGTYPFPAGERLTVAFDVAPPR